MDRQHGLGVLALAEGLPDLGAFGDAVLLLGRQQRERRLHLPATAAAELAADDRGDGDQVGQLERLDLAGVGDGVDLAGEDVLAREVAALLGLLPVGVDAVDIRLGIGHGLFAAGALSGPDLLDLGFEVFLGVRGLRPELLLQALVGKGATRERGQLAASDVAEEVHQPEPVLPGGEPGAELGAVAGGALDVRDTGRLVTGDGDVVAGRGDGLDLVLRHAERGVVEEVGQLLVGETRVSGHQAVVAVELVVAVGGMRTERLVAEDLDEGGVPVLARGQDVVALPLAVVGDGCGFRRGGRPAARPRAEWCRVRGPPLRWRL